jgi:lysozyme
LAVTSENERREQAFLALIRYAESNKQERPDAYNIRNGGDHFYDIQHHPGRRTTGHRSSASGAYQITAETYNELVRRGGPSDFSPQAQDALARHLTDEKGALPLIWDGQLQGAFSLLNSTWNSLTGGAHQLITETEAEAYFWQQVRALGR